MMNDQLLILVCVFAAVSVVGYVAVQHLLARGSEGKLRNRLAGGGIRRGEKHKRTFKQILQKIGQKAAKPFMPSDDRKKFVIRKSLARAGIYSPAADRVVIGAKVICLTVGVIIGYAIGLYSDELLWGFSVGGLAGYVAPLMWLKFQTGVNQRNLTYGLADALDLMVVCIEAGLTIDSALQRVGQELIIAHPAISREFGMAHMETRIGLSRTEALRNMGERTGNAAIRSLAAMLIQTERFGTSVADALRVHSESLRIARQLAAEELAGTASVKISFPLVLCIFPATLIILAGPTMLQLMESTLFK
jgi:tight adherence protein C